MGCGCNGSSSAPRSGGVQSWNDFLTMPPADPLDLIEFATLGGGPTPGTWALSNTYRQPTPPSTWIASPVAIAGQVGLISNDPTTAQTNFDGNAYNFSHTTANIAATLAPPLRKIVFMKAGALWTNSLPLSFTGSPDVVDVQLSFLENAATRGDAQGTIPVIQWTTPQVGTKLLNLTLKHPGRFCLGIVTINNNSTPGWAMFELDVVAT